MTSKFLDHDFVGECRPESSPFLVHPTSGTSLSFEEVFEIADRLSASIPKGVLLLAAKDRLFFSLLYIAALRSRTPVLVVDHETSDEALASLASAFKVGSVAVDGRDTFNTWGRVESSLNFSIFINPTVPNYSVNPQLAALMPTSGSTGSPKCVRVSYENIKASAWSIGKYLKIASDRVLITSLPLHYTYGLSLLHMAMTYRIPLILSEHSTLSPQFWDDFLTYKATDFSGVPFQYDMLLRSGTPEGVFEQMRCMTQAGGRLEPEKTKYFLELAQKMNFAFYTMYGQTEATPRISFVPPESAFDKLGSVGIAIPGGAISIDNPDVFQESGEVVYSGPNVCLGYASCAEDLDKADEFMGTLRTGDLGYLDRDGYLFLTGRASREVKVSGKRVNLDTVEQGLAGLLGEYAVLGVDEKILIVTTVTDSAAVRARLAASTSIHPSKFSLVSIPQLPRLSSGKTDYQKLRKEFLDT